VNAAPNIPTLEGFSFKKALAKTIDVPVLAHNDVNAALYGEHKFGAAVGCKHVIGIFIGTGIGGAILIDGKLYLGASGDAGDIGNYLLQPLGPLSGSARQGVLDDVASRTAIAADAAALAIKQWAPSLLENTGTDLRNIRSAALAEAISGGDKAVEELVRSRAHVVGIVLSNIVDFMNPELVVLGGGLTEALPAIIRKEVTAGIEGHASPHARRKLEVVTAKLEGHAVTIGAAKLALDDLNT
jgi:glucokinase